MSCSKNGSECGQGHYHHISRGWIDQLAPLIHWRVCAIWDWLSIYAPMAKFGSWETGLLAQAYGGEEAEEKNARTGCIGCNLVSKDKALLEIVKIPKWEYLSPLLDLRQMYAWLKLPKNRLRKIGFQTTKKGDGASNQNRMGPLTMEARKEGLERLLALIARVNKQAVKDDRPKIDIINAEEIDRIHWHWRQESWPQGWSGKEAVADLPFTQFYADGSSQDSLF